MPSGIDLPAADEVEVSIFGPGKGESVVVHLGGNRWIIVDSCIDQIDGSIPALRYLRDLGVDTNSSVLLVVGTHAHDDHIAGLSAVVEACSAASFVCSSALSAEEFYALIAADDRTERLLRRSSYREYRQIFETMSKRSAGPRSVQVRPILRALEGRPLLEVDVHDGSIAKVLALTPSDEAVTRSLKVLAAQGPRIGELTKMAMADPNELSVALWLHAGQHRILLGADLLKGPAGCGWQGILEWFIPNKPAEVFKVPHHGAPNAHWAGVWQDLLLPDPVVLLAPFRAGRTSRPNDEDVRRLSSLTARAYITASPKRVPAPRKVRVAAASVGQLGRRVQEPWGRSGHVRARAPLGGGPWSIELMPPARALGT